MNAKVSNSFTSCPLPPASCYKINYPSCEVGRKADPEYETGVLTHPKENLGYFLFVSSLAWAKLDAIAQGEYDL
ncbi:MAG: hypothetical protein V7K47_25890 [Nostoc sp.]